jgi:hypothetical protein
MMKYAQCSHCEYAPGVRYDFYAIPSSSSKRLYFTATFQMIVSFTKVYYVHFQRPQYDITFSLVLMHDAYILSRRLNTWCLFPVQQERTDTSMAVSVVNPNADWLHPSQLELIWNPASLASDYVTIKLFGYNNVSYVSYTRDNLFIYLFKHQGRA